MTRDQPIRPLVFHHHVRGCVHHIQKCLKTEKTERAERCSRGGLRADLILLCIIISCRR